MLVKFGKKIEVVGKSLYASIRKKGNGEYLVDFWTIGYHVMACSGTVYTAPRIDIAIALAEIEIREWETF